MLSYTKTNFSLILFIPAKVLSISKKNEHTWRRHGAPTYMYVTRVSPIWAVHTYLWKIHIRTLCSRPPFLDLDHSRQSFWWCPLIRNPIQSCKWVKVVSISSRLHCTYSEIVNIDILRPWSNCMVNCLGVIQVHVIKSYLNMNLFFWIKPVWWKYYSLATWIRPLGNTKKFFTAIHNGKT